MSDVPFRGSASRLCPADVARAAQALDCDAAAIEAVVFVESSGCGFLPDGRPKILFEAHRFGELTRHRHTAPGSNISSSHWDRTLYKGGAAEYSRLTEAMALDCAAALKSASWGLFQIMGEHHAVCGFATVEEFVRAMVEGEGGQLDAFASFVRANARMWDALRTLDWETFARLYNGRSYATHAYHTRLAAAYAARNPAMAQA